MEKLLISKCLLGVPCRYDGQTNRLLLLERLAAKYELIPVCPEVDGGLSTPRLPSEIKDGSVFDSRGNDVTTYFQKGAKIAVEVAKAHGISKALLKAKSPSCGNHQVYDGSFRGVLVDGEGIAAAALRQAGIEVFNEDKIEKLLCD